MVTIIENNVHANILKRYNEYLYRIDGNERIPCGRIYLSSPTTPSGPIKFCEGVKKMVFFFNRTKEETFKYSPASVFNNWVGTMLPLQQKIFWYSVRRSGDRKRDQVRAEFRGSFRFVEGLLNIHVDMIGYKKKEIRDKIYDLIIRQIVSIPGVQMEGQDGRILESSDRAGNTIVTRSAEQDEESEIGVKQIILPSICSTEQMHMFESIVNRWMALPDIQITTAGTFNSIVKVYNLPAILYETKKAPNILPFQSFIYGRYTIEFKFVVNANRFHVGKIVAAVKYDSYQADILRNDVVAMLSRPHVILDLSTNNEGVLSVPFKYHRTFVRNGVTDNSKYGMKCAQYASIVVAILSPLGAVAGAPTAMNIRPFYRIVEGQFTGMTHAVPVTQMETDKKYSRDVQQVVLRPRMNFQCGVGASDCVPMRINPGVETSYLPDHLYPEDPVDTLQIARIWGFAGSFEWSTSHTVSALLLDIPMDPLMYANKKWSGAPTPLSYIASMYQFWTGPVEYRFDFVTNAFHTGAVMISAQYGRGGGTVEDASSAYVKTFHLGEQKSVTFVAPYIYDTVWRRMNNTPMSCLKYNATGDETKGRNAIFRSISSRVRVNVVNQLVPVQAVPQKIKVLLFMRAGENFQFHSPIMTNMICEEKHESLTDFPDGVTVYKPDSGAKIMMEGESIQISHTWLQGKTPGDVEAGLQIRATSTQTEKKTTEEEVEEKEDEAGWSKTVPKNREFKFYNSRTGRKWDVKDATETSDIVIMPEIERIENGHFLFGKNYKRYKYSNGQIYVSDKWELMPAFAQMESGKKENKDITDEFSQGIVRNNVQTLENHTNIGSLLRRPVCIIDGVTVEATPDSGVKHYYIPCMPPSNLMAFTTAQNRDFAPGLNRSYHVHLMNLFRFWRGSQRYTIVSHRTEGEPIYVSYLPHSGAMLAGNQKWNADDVMHNNMNPSAMGLATEVMIPSLNPTCAIEVPFETEVNWCLTWCEDWSRHFSWRDKGDYNVGHIVVWSRKDFVMDVFWSAGSDFSVSNYYGPGRVVAPFPDFYYKDNYPKPQMEDFQISDTRENFISRVVKQIRLPLGIAAAGAVPVVGSSIAGAVVGHRMEQTLGTMETAAQTVTGEITSLAANFNDLVDLVKSKLAGVFHITGNICQALVNAVIDMVANVGNWNPRNIAMSVLRLIVNLCGVALDKVLHFLSPLTSLFVRSVRTQAEDSIEQISGSFWTDEKVKEVFKVVVAIFSALIGSVIHTPDRSWSGILKAVLGAPFTLQAVGMANGVLRFLDVTFNVLREAVLWIMGKTSFEAKAIQMLRSESVMIDDFCKESQIMLNECNKSALVHPTFRLRYWANVIRACEIQRRLVAIPPNKVSPVISRLCADVIKAGRETMSDLRSSPIKYEPYVICIEGAPGIGKSMLVRSLATKLLHEIGLSKYNGDPIFYRISGSRFWNGYVDQPVVVFDDFLNVSEPTSVATALNELYQLKSCATFVPEQAAIEEKKIKATPRIVILLCNNAFPEQILTNMVESREAVYRRRDLLVRAELKAEYQNRPLRDLNDAESARCAHLQFRQCLDVLNQESLTTVGVDYVAFEEYVVGAFKVYNAQELINVRRRMTSLFTFFQNANMPTLRDPFSIFYEGLVYVDTQENDGRLPSERLDSVIGSIVRGLAQIPEENFIDVPEMPRSPWEARAQMEYSSVTAVTCGALGVAAMLPLLSRLGNYIKECVLSKKPSPMLQCRVCLGEEPVHVICQQSWNTPQRSNEVLHAVCRSCYLALTVRGCFKCPTCRDETVPIRVIPKQFYDASSIIVKMYKMGQSIENIGNAVRSLFVDVDLARAYTSFIVGLAGVATTLNKVKAHFDPASQVTCALSNWTIVGVTFVSLVLGARMKNGEASLLEGSLTSVDEVPSIVQYRLNMGDLTEQIDKFNNAQTRTMNEFTRLNRLRSEWLREKMGDRFDDLLPLRQGVRLSADEMLYNSKVLKYNERLLRGHSAVVENDLLREVHQLAARLPTIVQMDGCVTIREPYPMLVTSPLQANDIFDYQFNEAAVSLVSEAVVQERCLHNIMRDNCHHVKYVDGKYMILLHEGWINIPNNPCANPECCWLDQTEFVACMKKFFDEHKALWLGWILKLEGDRVQENIRRHLPKYAWPSWISMAEPVPLGEIMQPNWYEKIEIAQILKVALTGLAVCTTVLVVCKTVSGFIKCLMPEPQIIPSGDAVIRHFKPKIERIQRGTVSPQAEFMDVMTAKVNENYFILSIEIEGEIIKRLIGVGIKQRLGIMPRHYYDFLLKQMQKEGAHLYFAKASAPALKVRLSFEKNNFWVSETADICVVQLPASVNMFKDIVKYMAKDKDLQGKMSNTGIMVQPKLDKAGITVVVPLDIKGYVRRQYVVSDDGGYYSEHCLSYNYSCNGACGSLVLKDHSQRPIVAMHFAGTGIQWQGIGYGTIVTQEMFSDFDCAVSAQALDVEVRDLIDIEKAKIHLPVDSNVEYLGVLPKNLTPHTPYKSKIKPSLIQGVVPWETMKAPAILSGKDIRYEHDVSPLVAGCAKHGYLTHDFPMERIQSLASLRYQKLMKAKPKVVPCRRLTIQEAIVGFECLPYYDPLHLDTSAGWPLCATSKTLKSDYCVVERNEEGRVVSIDLDERVVNMVKDDEEKRRQGIVPCTIFVDTLKDEKRKEDKLKKLGGTRVFCASPFAFSIAMRQNFLHFVASYMYHRRDLNHAVGINLQGREASELVSALLGKGFFIVTIDYANFGPGFNAGVAHAAARNMVRWTVENVEGVNEAELSCLVEENVNSVHAMHNLVYRQKAGSPSGSPITVVINTEVNLLYLMLAWDALINEDDKWTKFEENVCQFAYGDDLIMSVSDAFKEKYNAVTITEYFAQFRIVATDASKKQLVRKYTGLEDAEFLKCKFAPHPERRGEWIAQLNLDSVMDTPLWIKEEIDFKGATRVNAEAGIRAAYGHGRKFFNDYRDKVNKALIEKGIEPILLTWDCVDEQYYAM